MKNHFFRGKLWITILLISLTTLLTGCQPDDPAKTYGDQPTPALSANGTVPRMTMSEYQSLVQDQDDEGKLYQKLSLITYAVTEFIGGHTGLGTDNGNLAAVFPCGDGFLDNTGGFYRFLSDQSGMPIAQVHTTLGGYIAARITNFPATSGELHATVFLNLIASLRMEGRQLDFVAKRPQTILPNNNNEIFISFGAYTTPQGAPVVAGYRWHRQSGVVSYDEKRAFASAAGVNMVMFEPVEDGAETLNDPCYYTYNPGGGSGGGGSGGSGGGGGSDGPYDDDGSMKKPTTSGPVVIPDIGGVVNCLSYGITNSSLRVNRFHINDRNEGGLFSGASEVFVHASFYFNTSSSETNRTDNGCDLLPLTYDTASCFVSLGLQLKRVPEDDAKPGNHAVHIPDADKNWILVENGFCEGYGYNRVFLTFYEKDNVFSSSGADIPKYFSFEWYNVSICDYHHRFVSVSLDDWFTNKDFILRPSMFEANGGKLWLTEVPPGYAVYTSQPPDVYSWFEVELY